MYLRESSQKRADGTIITHLQLAESVWDKRRKRTTTKLIYTFGRAGDPAVVERLRRLARSILRRCSPEEIIADEPSWRLVDAWPYGAIFALETLWQRLGIDVILRRCAASRKIGFDVERALFAMVANRASAPCSKLYCYEQWLREDVRIEGTQALELQHLYRAMDFLSTHRAEVEESIFFRVSDLLNLDVDLIFYDTTSLHFEVDEEDGDETAETTTGPGESGARRRLGYSKNGRSDAPQVVVGLAVTRDGLPVRHWVFPGNTVDVTTVATVKEALRGWRLGRCMFVGDAGMVSAENLRTLSLGGGRYLVGMPAHRGGEVAQEVLTRSGRYSTVAGNLRVKDVEVGDGERRRRYVVCHNPEEEARQRKHRERVLAELEAELATLADCSGEAHTRRMCELRASRRHGRYLRTLKDGSLRIDRAAVRRAEKLDGKFVVHSNDDTLSAEDMALGYKQLLRVEAAWRTLKSGLRMRPVYHRTASRIEAHIALTVLALLLERVAETTSGETWRNIRDTLNGIKLAQLSGPDGTVFQVTAPRSEARKLLKSLQIEDLPTILTHN